MNISEQEKNIIRDLHKNHSIIKEQSRNLDRVKSTSTDEELEDAVDSKGFQDAMKDAIDVYVDEMGIDRETEKQLDDMFWYMRNKTNNGLDTQRWDSRYLKSKFPKAAMLLPPSEVIDFYCKFKK